MADKLTDEFNKLSTKSSDERGDASSSGSAPGGESTLQSGEYGKPIAALYTGDELLKHVAKFLKNASNLAEGSNDVKLYVCSPFYIAEYYEKKVKVKDATIMQKLMEIILAAENLTTVFYTRLKVDIRTKNDYTIKNELIDSLLSEQKDKFLKKLQSGKIKVWETVYPQYFHCKWLAIEQDRKVELLVTSANLTKQHLYDADDQEPHNFYENVAKSLEARYYDQSAQKNPFEQYLPFKQVDYAEYKNIKKSEFDQDFIRPMRNNCFWRSPRDYEQCLNQQ